VVQRVLGGVAFERVLGGVAFERVLGGVAFERVLGGVAFERVSSGVAFERAVVLWQSRCSAHLPFEMDSRPLNPRSTLTHTN